MFDCVRNAPLIVQGGWQPSCNFDLAFSKNLFCSISSSHRRCSVRKGVPKDILYFTGKHLWWCLVLIFNSLLIKLQDILGYANLNKHVAVTCNLSKRDPNADVSPWNLKKIFEELFWTTSANVCFSSMFIFSFCN